MHDGHRIVDTLILHGASFENENLMYDCLGECSCNIPCIPIEIWTLSGRQLQRKYSAVAKILSRRQGLQNCRKKTKLPDSGDYPRFVIVDDFSKWVERYNMASPKVLLSFANDFENAFLNITTKLGYVYEPFTEKKDLHKLSKRSPELKGLEPDLAILGQTLEHLYDPFLAMTNIFNVLAPGAYFFTSTPFVNIPHMTPIHFQHTSAMGLSLLMHRVGFDVIEVAEWGSLAYEKQLFSAMNWPGPNQLPAAKVKDENGTHVDQVWGLFRKPLA